MQFNKLSDCISYYQQYHLTKHKYQWRADHLLWFDNIPLSDIRKHHIKKYHAYRSVSNATINREISFARSAINRVNIDYESSIYNAFDNINFVEKDVIPNFLTYDDYLKLLKACDKLQYTDLKAFIILLAMTGCRPMEILTLTWDNVYLDKKLFIVRNCWSKSKRTMYKYLNETAIEVLASRDRVGEWVFTNTKTNKPIGSYHKCFDKVRKLARVDCTFYDLRHTYASWLVQKSVPIYTVKDLLGHRDISSTMRYAHLDYEAYCNALAKIG